MNFKVTDDPNHTLNKILKEFDSQDPQERVACIKRLGQMEIQIEDFPMNLHIKLEEALLDSNEEIRKEAAIALAFLEGEVAIPLLEPLLDDSSQSVRSNTISAFGYIGIRPPEDVIKKMMNFLHSSDSDEIRDRCARTLGRLKIYQAKDPLLRLAQEDSSPTVRGGAVVALGMLKGDLQLKKEIAQLLESETAAPVLSLLRETLALIEAHLDQTES
ncbi:MAG: HEAT repeat domain-containing protein [Candidatus Heimdallarchaeota archaeon]|nr:MAG: HEAT repeat domain-containing protein [Candidatus Heimdallarchaeota archaeon]